MKKRAMLEFENGYLLLVFILILQQLFIYIYIGTGNPLTVEMYILSIVGLFSVVFGYFLGFRAAIGYAIVFTVVMLFYLLRGHYDVEMFHYIWFLVVSFSAISSAFLNATRKQIYVNEEYLQTIEKEAMYVNPATKMMTGYAMYDTVMKHAAFAKRYSEYEFCIMMIRIEFVEMIKMNQGEKEFNSLMYEISRIIRGILRVEDYKFLIERERFIIIFPMTPLENLQMVKERIAQKVTDLKIYDKNEHLINIVLKMGIMECSDYNHKYFSDISKLLLLLERKTEEDIHAEYKD